MCITHFGFCFVIFSSALCTLFRVIFCLSLLQRVNFEVGVLVGLRLFFFSCLIMLNPDQEEQDQR